MAGRGRGRGRGGGFGRGNPFPGADQLNLNPADKMPVVQIASTPYPVLDHYPASLSVDKEYDELIDITNRLSSYFQASRYNLKMNDENTKLFQSQGEVTLEKKTSLNFNWDYFPLELRPTNKRKIKDQNELLANFRRSKLSSINLSLLDKLEEKEKVEVQDTDLPMEEEGVEGIKKDPDELLEDDENDEFDDDELDDGNDYNMNHFDDGGGYLDEDDELDEGPCY
ncbi:uncharacterized protein Polr3G [Planococcus citri]|uniref:uncharacterized protein Polr3G n=1 Tax=Planococcus citri TaxID=170843 RepID=UPI0031F91876